MLPRGSHSHPGSWSLIEQFQVPREVNGFWLNVATLSQKLLAGRRKLRAFRRIAMQYSMVTPKVKTLMEPLVVVELEILGQSPSQSHRHGIIKLLEKS